MLLEDAGQKVYAVSLPGVYSRYVSTCGSENLQYPTVEGGGNHE